MTGRLSQAISEGDGISVLVEVLDGDSARAAEEQGAEGLVLRAADDGVRTATHLAVVLYGPSIAVATAAHADAVVVGADRETDELVELVADASERGLDCVLKVRDEDDLERALEHIDPEILLLSAEDADDDQPQLERLLELLADVPAGKLAIAELAGASAGDVEELERAGVDAVLVTAGDVAALVGDAPPEV